VFSNVEFTDFRLPAFSIRPALRIDHSSQAGVRNQRRHPEAVESDRSGGARLRLLGGFVLYDLRHSDLRVRWLVTLLLRRSAHPICSAPWMVGLYAGFSPRKVAETYGPAGEATMAMQMPPDSRSWPSVPSRWPRWGRSTITWIGIYSFRTRTYTCRCTR